MMWQHANQNFPCGSWPARVASHTGTLGMQIWQLLAFVSIEWRWARGRGPTECRHAEEMVLIQRSTCEMSIGRPICVLMRSNGHTNERSRSKMDRDLTAEIVWSKITYLPLMRPNMTPLGRPCMHNCAV